jgi:hypothetical protein
MMDLCGCGRFKITDLGRRQDAVIQRVKTPGKRPCIGCRTHGLNDQIEATIVFFFNVLMDKFLAVQLSGWLCIHMWQYTRLVHPTWGLHFCISTTFMVRVPGSATCGSHHAAIPHVHAFQRPPIMRHHPGLSTVLIATCGSHNVPLLQWHTGKASLHFSQTHIAGLCDCPALADCVSRSWLCVGCSVC